MRHAESIYIKLYERAFQCESRGPTFTRPNMRLQDEFFLQTKMFMQH